MLVDVPNRGHAYAEALYNSPRDVPFLSGTLEQGTGFLQDHGFTVAEVYWELGHDADLPSFVDADGKTRYVEGVGFAIVRDAADFLAHAAADSAGTPNPLKGAINRVLASGKSQDGRFLKTFLLNGFNMAGRSARIRWNARFRFGSRPSPDPADGHRTAIERRRGSHLRQSGFSRRE